MYDLPPKMIKLFPMIPALCKALGEGADTPTNLMKNETVIITYSIFHFIEK